MGQGKSKRTNCPCLESALRYAAQGRHVLRPRGGVPLTAHRVNDATVDEAMIHGWWERWPNAGVAIAIGLPSGLVVLDVDGSEGHESLAILERQHGKLPATLEWVVFPIEELQNFLRRDHPISARQVTE